MNYSQSAIERELKTLQGANIFLEKHGLKPTSEISIAALKKQIKVTPDPPGYCPRCSHRIFFQRQNYCIYCGQAIRRAE